VRYLDTSTLAGQTVPVRFVIQDATQRYHLPILFTPWGYSYYRGS